MSAAVLTGVLTEADARTLTAEIRGALVVAWDKIVIAYNGRVWNALGYDSWDDYCETEFDGSRIRLPREERRELVSSLRESGLSVRAIAAATGTNRETIRQDAAAGDKKLSPAKPQLSEVITDDEVDELRVPDPDPQRTTGLDGKSYQRPTPKPEPDVIDAEVVEDEPPDAKPHRRPIPEAFWQAAYDLSKVTERIERLVEDDRFPQNAEKVATKHRSDLTRAIDALQGVVNRLPPA